MRLALKEYRSSRNPPTRKSLYFHFICMTSILPLGPLPNCSWSIPQILPHFFLISSLPSFFPQALLGRVFLPLSRFSMNQHHQGPWDSRGSFAMILWGFGPEEESRSFKTFDILYIILSLFYHQFKKKLFRRNFSQIPWHQMQHRDFS